MDLELNNLLRLIRHKIQITKQPASSKVGGLGNAEFPSLSSLSVLLWPGVVVVHRILSMDQIELFDIQTVYS